MSGEMKQLLIAELEEIVSDLEMTKADYAKAVDIDAGNAVTVRDTITAKRLKLLVKIVKGNVAAEQTIEAL